MKKLKMSLDQGSGESLCLKVLVAGQLLKTKLIFKRLCC